MAGIEVAGLVLGAIPLIITAFDVYKGTVSKVARWRRYTREVDRVVRSLRLEHTRLESICEKLLNGLVPEIDIEAMMKHPRGPLWKAKGLHDKIGFRLWKSREDFMGTIEDINSAIDEISIKLNLIDGEVQWDESRIKREFKRTTFTLDSSAYKELLDRIANDVTQIDNLLNANISLEQPRRRMSQWRFYQTLRDVTSGLFRAFRSAFVCQCPESHTIDFVLRKPSNILSSACQDDDTRILKAVDFQVAVTYQAPLPNNQPRTLRDGLIVRPVTTPDHPSVVLSKSSTTSTPASTKKSVRFSSFRISSTSVKVNTTRTSSAVSTLVQDAVHIPKMLSMPGSTSPKEASRLVDICRTIRNSPAQPHVESAYGYICDERSTGIRKYQLYPTNIIREDNDTISLGAILSECQEHRLSLSLETRLYLAVVLASSFLQLSGTGWLAEVVTHQDVFFAKRNGCISYREPSITKLFTEPGELTEKQLDGALPYNAPLFSLGILLIEIILVTPFHALMGTEDLEQHSNHGISKHVMEYKAAMSLLDRVRSTGDEAYKHAVRCCIENEYKDQGLEDKDIQEHLYTRVFERLEQSLEALEHF